MSRDMGSIDMAHDHRTRLLLLRRRHLHAFSILPEAVMWDQRLLCAEPTWPLDGRLGLIGRLHVCSWRAERAAAATIHRVIDYAPSIMMMLQRSVRAEVESLSHTQPKGGGPPFKASAASVVAPS